MTRSDVFQGKGVQPTSPPLNYLLWYSHPSQHRGTQVFLRSRLEPVQFVVLVAHVETCGLALIGPADQSALLVGMQDQYLLLRFPNFFLPSA